MTWSDVDLFYGKVKFGNLGFSMGKNVKTEDFSETIAASDLKVGRCRQFIEFSRYVSISRFCMFCALVGQDIR